MNSLSTVASGWIDPKKRKTAFFCRVAGNQLFFLEKVISETVYFDLLMVRHANPGWNVQSLKLHDLENVTASEKCTFYIAQENGMKLQENGMKFYPAALFSKKAPPNTSAANKKPLLHSIILVGE